MPRTIYCEHDDENVTVKLDNSMWGGAEWYCSACGDHGHMTQKELEADEDRILNPPLRTLEDLEIENEEAGCFQPQQ